MRFSWLAVIACFACSAACTEGIMTKLDGRTKRDGGKKDRGPLVPDIEQPDLEVVDQQVVKPDQQVVKPDQLVVDKSTLDLKKVDQSKVVDLKKVDQSKVVDLKKADGPVVTGKLVINEIDYDQPGTDTAEFLEIYNGTSAAVSLADLAVVFVNGGTSTEYERVLLAPATSLPAGGYLVVATPAVTVDAAAKKILFAGASDQIQNGAPDGVALVNTATKQVIDSLAYEGAMTAVTITGFTSVSLVEGTVLATSVADGNTQAGSLVRLPNGIDTDNANSDWKLSTTPTPGKANQ